jgi:hypothetical protein
MQMGRHATKNILFLIRGDKSKPFRYFDKGSMATIGRNKAIADLKICLLWRVPCLAEVAICPPDLFNWAAQSTVGALPVDLGLLCIRAGRAAHLRNIPPEKDPIVARTDPS